MAVENPDPPDGIRDLNSQPAIATDRKLLELRETLESELPSYVFDDLSRWRPAEEPEPDPDEDYRERALLYDSKSIDYREAIRPESLRASTDLPEKVGRTTVGPWVWYHNGYKVEHERPARDAKEDESGKFLLFAPEEARALEDVVLDEFSRRPYSDAKLPTIPGKREDWVLCLYQPDNRYWYDVRDAYHDPPRVRFRGYKTNAATHRGEYSDRFKNAQ
jgi:hypothetical protein